MVEKLKFERSFIEDAEAEYNKLKLAKDQKERISSYVRLISRYIPLPERALKGFMWRVLKEYQIENHQVLAEEATMKGSKAEIINGIERVFSMLKDQLTRTLVSNEQAPLLDKAFNEITEIVLKQYMKV
ncbi:MAG: hypothetical protein ACFFAS_01305 [Promethearchaeota archaeon]